LSVNTSWSEDAGAGAAAAQPQPQAEPDTHCISKKAAAEAAAKRRPAPTQAEAMHAAQGSAGQGAGPILSLTCDYCCSNLKGDKIFDK